ncbi:KPN_02809 family neutral zinc metallopeptidase [Avrilella dinanensis]|uniref:Metalloprotease n=1 Tax=Avrilella dinanensis TaxID=2008672 RepID=A0A2M9R7C2_9FLAO|nr:neutral zinc metallopeptidase [Avrilella dinanensis]PJR04756.1 metalloprotease [Avrilella dinanensis]
MKWEKRKSDKFEDRRGMSGGQKTLLGGGVIGIIALLLTMFGGETGQMIGTVLQQVQPAEQTTSGTQTRELSEEEKTLGNFSEFVFDINNETWEEIFAQNGMKYQEPGMVLFDDGVNTACGNASSAVGPFYCPADQKVYMDLRFFDELHTRFGAKEGEFAIAYVIAHEIGHHVQNLLGTNEQVRKAQQQTSQVNANKLSVAQELQADFYAGVWASYNEKWLEPGDIEVAISAASAVGDDSIQKRVQGEVNPDSFTHGTSKQRVEWFMKGYQTRDIKQGDTFSALLR